MLTFLYEIKLSLSPYFLKGCIAWILIASFALDNAIVY